MKTWILFIVAGVIKSSYQLCLRAKEEQSGRIAEEVWTLLERTEVLRYTYFAYLVSWVTVRFSSDSA